MSPRTRRDPDRRRLPGCDDFERPLSHCYTFVCDNYFECIVADSTRRLVTGSSITAIGRTGDVVYGVIEPSPESPVSVDSAEWFVVNTRTHEISFARRRAEWDAAVRRQGIPNEPSIRAPSRFGEL